MRPITNPADALSHPIRLLKPNVLGDLELAFGFRLGFLHVGPRRSMFEATETSMPNLVKAVYPASCNTDSESDDRWIRKKEAGWFS